jgi:hypothetical protein
MADQEPEVRWQAVSGPFAEAGAPETPSAADTEIL